MFKHPAKPIDAKWRQASLILTVVLTLLVLPNLGLWLN